MSHRILSRSARALTIAGVLGLLSLPSFAAPITPIALVGGNVGAPYSVAVGQTITIPVSTTLVNASPTQGIFTYDFNALVANSGLQVISYTLDGDLALGNQTFITIDAAGAHNLNAGFDNNGVGTTGPAELFTVTLQGVTAGPNALNISDSIIPQNAPIVLYDDSEPLIDTMPISITVLPAAPEPASIALLVAGLPLILRRRR